MDSDATKPEDQAEAAPPPPAPEDAPPAPGTPDAEGVPFAPGTMRPLKTADGRWRMKPGHRYPGASPRATRRRPSSRIARPRAASSSDEAEAAAHPPAPAETAEAAAATAAAITEQLGMLLAGPEVGRFEGEPLEKGPRTPEAQRITSAWRHWLEASGYTQLPPWLVLAVAMVPYGGRLLREKQTRTTAGGIVAWCASIPARFRAWRAARAQAAADKAAGVTRDEQGRIVLDPRGPAPQGAPQA